MWTPSSQSIRRCVLAFVAAAAALLGGCEVSAAPPYMGKTYSGRVRAEVERNDLPITKRRFGSATAEFTRLSSDRARLVLFGTIDKEGDAGFTIEGRYDDSGFRAESSGLSVTVDAAGRISGGGVVKDQQYSFEGSASATDFDLRVQNRPTSQASPSPILRVGFTYELATEDKAKSAAADRKCRKIRYEMRPVANIGEGTMSMLRVPVCLK